MPSWVRGGGALGLAALLLLGSVAAVSAGAPAVVDWSLETADGGRVQFSETLSRGPVLISFWALWCAPCLKELPHVDQLARDFDAEVADVFPGRGRGGRRAEAQR